MYNSKKKFLIKIMRSPLPVYFICTCIKFLQTFVPLTLEEEDTLKKQLDEPAPPLSEESMNCCPPDFENILSSLLNCQSHDISTNFDDIKVK